MESRALAARPRRLCPGTPRPGRGRGGLASSSENPLFEGSLASVRVSRSRVSQHLLCLIVRSPAGGRWGRRLHFSRLLCLRGERGDRPMTEEGLRQRRSLDPRIYQILTLASLLAYGVLRLDLEVRAVTAGVLLATALLTQYAGTRLARLPAFDPKSALISGLSLCLLL